MNLSENFETAKNIAVEAAQAAAPAERSFTPYSAARRQQANNSALSYEQRTDSMNDAYLDL